MMAVNRLASSAGNLSVSQKDRKEPGAILTVTGNPEVNGSEEKVRCTYLEHSGYPIRSSTMTTTASNLGLYL